MSYRFVICFVLFFSFFFLFFYHHSETSEQVTYLTTTDESFKPCDMDERDWTSLESSSESIIDFNADGEFKVSRIKHDLELKMEKKTLL